MSMKIQEYMDMINDWNSDIPMNMSILITKGLRKFLTSYTKYNEDSEFNRDILAKLKEIIVRDNGKAEWEEACIYIDSFIGTLRD